jgi:phage pi2 protein 07
MKSATLNHTDVQVLIQHLDMQLDIANDTSTEAMWKDLSEYSTHDNINITKCDFIAMRLKVDAAIDNLVNLTAIHSSLHSNQNGGTFEYRDDEYNSLVFAISNQIAFLEDTINEKDDNISIYEKAADLVNLVNTFNKIK